MFEVCDIKLPNERIIKTTKNREEFYSKIGTNFAGQLRNYASYFNDYKNRLFVKQKYGIKVNKYPEKILIIGRNDNVDKFKVHEILDSRGHEFRLVTYDDILENLQHSLNNSYISEKQFFGSSFLILLKINLIKKGRDRFIIDLGDSERQNRFSIYLNTNDNLCFRVIDDEGNEFSITLPKTVKKIDSKSYFYLHCSVGCSENYSIMEMYINGVRIEKREFKYRLFKNRGLSFNKRFFSCDLIKCNGSEVSFELIKAFNHNLNLIDRSNEDNYFFRRLKWVNSIDDLCHVYFNEKAFSEIPYQYGQKSTLPPGVEGIWDVNDIYSDGLPEPAHYK